MAALLRERAFLGRSPLSLCREGGRLVARAPPGDGMGPGEDRVLCGLAGGGDMTDGLDSRGGCVEGGSTGEAFCCCVVAVFMK